MYLTQWYAVSIGAIACCLLLHRVGSVAIIFLTRYQYYLLKHLIYPVFIKRRRDWKGFTRFQSLLVGGYFVINGFCMGMGIDIHDTSALIIRSGTMASINMIPLFFGGRTSTIVNFLGISLHSYYLAHHWIGRVVVIQGLIHMGLVLRYRSPWTFDTLQISGITVS